MLPEYLFVYGTLHPDHAPAEVAADVRRFVPVVAGTVRGELRQMTGYPALRMGADVGELVPGMIFELPDDPGLLARLDAYEDFRPDDPVSSLFVREQVPVKRIDGGFCVCWVYLYNRN
jgi:gamma-glutamylcyclotransferase (GGCT)/AIG2-like uncharacterized protein YtfP